MSSALAVAIAFTMIMAALFLHGLVSRERSWHARRNLLWPRPSTCHSQWQTPLHKGTVKDLGHEDPPVPGGYTGFTKEDPVLKMHSVTFSKLFGKGLVDFELSMFRFARIPRLNGRLIDVDDRHPRNPLAEELCKKFSTLR